MAARGAGGSRTRPPRKRVDQCGAGAGIRGRAGGRRLSVAAAPADLAELWAVRDQSAEAHRAAYTGVSRQVPLPDPRLHDALYDRHMVPDAWQPYPDAAEVLGSLRERGVAVGVVSNIGWDLRPVFRGHGLDPFVGTYVLSYEHGIQKPDTRLFATACDALGIAPEDTLMVGDDRRADGVRRRWGVPCTSWTICR